MKITFWKGVFVADHQPGEERLLKKACFDLHEPTLCDDSCRACRARIGRRYWSPRIEDATRLRDYCTDRALAVMKHHLQKLAASRATTAHINVPTPADLTFSPYQKAGIAYALNRKDTLFADEMGLGKTVEALGVVNCLRPRSVLVVSPATLTLNWRAEIEKWLVGRYRIVIPKNSEAEIPLDELPIIAIINYEKITGTGSKKQKVLLEKILTSEKVAHFLTSANPDYVKSLAESASSDPACTPVIVPDEHNPNYFRTVYSESRVEAARSLGWDKQTCIVLPAGTPTDEKSIKEAKKARRDTPLSRSLHRNWDVAIWDEAQALKNPDSQRSIAVLGPGGYYHLARRNLFLSGTPMENSPKEIWPIASVICPARFGEWWTFARRYCGLHAEMRGSRKVWVADGSTRAPELQQRLRTSFMIRRLKRDVLPELPPKRRQIMVLDEEINWSSRPEFKRWHDLYQQDFNTSFARLETARNPEEYQRAVRALDTITVPFEETSNYRHETGLLKLPSCLRYTDQMLDAGLQCCIIYGHHRDVLEKIHEHYGKESCVLYGDTDKEDRMPIVQAFQQGRYRIFIAGLRAAGVGITLTRASTGIFFETDWNPATIVQAEDRMHRIGQKWMVQLIYPVLDQSLDANMIKKFVTKQNMIDKILNQSEILQTNQKTPASH